MPPQKVTNLRFAKFSTDFSEKEIYIKKRALSCAAGIGTLKAYNYPPKFFFFPRYFTPVVSILLTQGNGSMCACGSLKKNR